MLATAGFKDVHNIVVGMEGDGVEEQDSVLRDQRMKNGWTNPGCPRTDERTPDRMLLPKAV